MSPHVSQVMRVNERTFTNSHHSIRQGIACAWRSVAGILHSVLRLLHLLARQIQLERSVKMICTAAASLVRPYGVT